MNLEFLASSLIARALTLAVLKSVYGMKISVERKGFDAELVPKVSERIINEKFLGEKKINLSELGKPIEFKRRRMVLPVPRNYETPERFNMKLDGLLDNPAVSLIEVYGPDKPLGVIMNRQKQKTRIVLNRKEIKDFLEKIAAEARIPLIEGVFRAAVDNFVVNAIVNEDIGSRFVLRKVGAGL